MSKLALNPAHPPASQYSFSPWLLLLLIGVYPLSAYLPATWGWENGVFENTQVVVLLLGFIAALRQRGSALAATVAPLWLLLVARELSWGAVFLPPVGFEEGQPVYSAGDFWFHPMIAPAVLLLLLWFVVTLYRRGLYGPLIAVLLKQRELQLVLLLGLVAAAGSASAEGHFGWHLAVSADRAEIVEEGMELMAYIALVCAQHLTLLGMQRQGQASAALRRCA